jgi:hypothetical protein
MSNDVQMLLIVVIALGIFAFSIRVMLLLRRKRRWERLNTSSESLQFARKRILSDLEISPGKLERDPE